MQMSSVNRVISTVFSTEVGRADRRPRDTGVPKKATSGATAGDGKSMVFVVVRDERNDVVAVAKCEQSDIEWSLVALPDVGC